MASIVNDKNGRKRLMFVLPNGNRKTIRLGKAGMKHAESVKTLIEALQAVQLTGTLDKETAARVSALDDALHAKLAATGLVDPRVSTTLEGWIKSYLESRASDLKPKSLKKLEDTREALFKYLPRSIPLRRLTPQHASDWRANLEQTLSVASVKTYCGNAKTIFAEAVRRKLIPENPFQHLRSGSTASKYTYYVTPEEIERVIDSCPNAEWRLLFGLARYAGLRIPSESHLLTVNDVDWSRGRMTIRSPKTEHHDGRDQRIVPVSAKLMPLLQARYDQLKEGEPYFITISGQGNMMRWIRKICDDASVNLWKRVWQTLRASCEKEWALTLPQYVVSQWIGHSIIVSGKHYANSVPDELYDRVAQNAAQQVLAEGRSVSQQEMRPPRISQEIALSGSHSLECIGGGGNRTRVP